MQNEKQIGVAIGVFGVILAFLAIPQAQSFICSLSGFLCSAIEAEDTSLRFFVQDKSSNPNLFENLTLREPNQDERKYDTRFTVLEAQHIYFDLSFRYKSVRLYSDFTIKPVCFFSSSKLDSRKKVNCRIQNFSLDSTDDKNTLNPKENVFQKIALLDLSNEVGSDLRGNYQIKIEIGGEGEPIHFKEVSEEFSIF